MAELIDEYLMIQGCMYALVRVYNPDDEQFTVDNKIPTIKLKYSKRSIKGDAIVLDKV